MAEIGYIRVSTDEQEASGLGLEAQRATIVKYLGHEPSAWFQDALGGKRADRPGLLAALDALHKGDVLIVAKRDRLARNVMLMCWILKEVKKRRATMVSASGEGTDGDGPEYKLLGTMIDAFAEFERDIISARTTAALSAKRARGEKRGGPVPYGFSVTYEETARGRVGTLHRNEVEVAVLKTIRNGRSRGLSFKAVADELNAAGVTTRSGGKWCAQYVYRFAKR